MSENMPFIWWKNYRNESSSKSNMMDVQIVSRVVRVVKALFKRSQKNTVVTHYSEYRWCDSTERALNEQLMGRRNWTADRFF